MFSNWKSIETVAVVTYKDPLTGLRTGETCRAELDRLTREMQAGRRDFAIALMDVNKTHYINELYGRDKGADLKDRDKRLDYMSREMANMQMAFDEWKRLSIAVGIACCEPGDKTIKDVLKRADSAMMDHKDDHYARR